MVRACPAGRTGMLQLPRQASTSCQQHTGAQAPHLWLSPLLSRMSRLFSSVSCATRCRLQHAKQGEMGCNPIWDARSCMQLVHLQKSNCVELSY